MELIKYFFRKYPARTLLVILSLMLASIIEGLSVGALLPLVSVAVERSNNGVSGPDSNYALFDQLFDLLGIQPSIESILLFIVSGIFLKSAISFGSKYYAGGTAVRASKDLRLQLLDAISKAQWKHFVTQPSGKVIASLISEAGRAAEGYMLGINLVASCIQIAVYVMIAIFISWQMALAAILLSIIMLVSLHKLVLITKRVGIKATKVCRSIAIQLNDSFSSIKSLKAMGLSDIFNTLLSPYIKKLARVERKNLLSSEGLTAAQDPLLIIGLALGMYAALEWLTLPFNMLLLMLFALLRVVKTFGKAQKQYQGLVGQVSGFEGIIETIDFATQHEERFLGKKQVKFHDQINFDDVTFYHDNAKILSNCCLTFYHKQLVSIIGPSGSGKTTLIDLIAGLYRPESGNILIDNIPLDEIDIQHWRQQIGYVMQETTLISETVAENIRLGNKNISDNEINVALKRAHAFNFVHSLEEKLESYVGEQGSRLSGGQRQRILIARALARKPSVLILDEATSALDKKTEISFAQTLRELSSDMLIISVSHRPAIVDVSDKVYSLSSGICIEAEKSVNSVTAHHA